MILDNKNRNQRKNKDEFNMCDKFSFQRRFVQGLCLTPGVHGGKTLLTKLDIARGASEIWFAN